MLRILGSARQLCDGVSRRDLLRVSGLVAASQLSHAIGAAAPESPVSHPASFGRAKRMILLFLYGAAPQHETFDPKPEAPAEIRGDWGAIPTVVPGVHIGEHLPRLAQMADRLTFVRSMSHPHNVHSVAFALTGNPQLDIVSELFRPLGRDNWPCFGSVVDYLDRQQNGRDQQPAIPGNLALPFQFSSRVPGLRRGGPYGGFLGRAYDPVWTEFLGDATQRIQRWTGTRDMEVADPYMGINPDGRFIVSRDAALPTGVTLDRLDRRRSLREQLTIAERQLADSPGVAALDAYQQSALSLLTSSTVRDALDVTTAPAARRERYGMTLFGQATLAGCRLLEAGARMVSVFWDEFGTVNSSWDTHFSHFERLKDELLPGLDAALTGLLTDLEERGILDDTLVACLTEHGRTPKLHPKPRGVGREHWSQAYSVALAGGGIARGRVIGESDREGGFVVSNPVTPQEIQATMYHLLGIDHTQRIPDHVGRPVSIVPEAEVVDALLA